MKIGIIGAGITGLTAGKVLAEAGHSVMIYEQGAFAGGRMASMTVNQWTADIGLPYFKSTSPEYKDFLEELASKNILREWKGDTYRYDEGKKERLPDEELLYIAEGGMMPVADSLGRWLDIRFHEKIGGITKIASSQTKKSPWMINSSRIEVFPADAVILAVPAVQAYGLVSTAQDELPLRKMVSVLDEISYSACCSFVAVYENAAMPDWKLLRSKHPVVSMITNESSKRETGKDVVLVGQTSSEYTHRMQEAFDGSVHNKEIKKALSEMLGPWAGKPAHFETRHWKFKGPKKKLEGHYLESDDETAPFAVAGDFFQGVPFETAYLSGLRLGKDWAERFS
ncbi:FAD-dependent oxidoreductase [Balneolaceae bacterium ANBcel3]|nr:FAD-dependent oxidoreductase [Balneolaceae bacterium ANBcel3]